MPFGIAHEHVGSIAGAAQGALGDREVVPHQIELRVPALGKQHLARVRDRDLPARDVNHLVLSLRRHASYSLQKTSNQS